MSGHSSDVRHTTIQRDTGSPFPAARPPMSLLWRVLLRLDGIVARIVRPARFAPRGIAMMRAMLGDGGRTELEWRQFWQRHVRTMGRFVIRYAHASRIPVENLRAEMEIHGAGNIHAALEAGRGAILLCSHTGPLLAQLIFAGSLDREAWAFGNPLRPRCIEPSFTRFHRRIGIERKQVGRGHSAEIRVVLQRNGLIVTFCDLTTVVRNNAWVPFGRTETLVNLGPALLGLREDAPMLVLTSRAFDDGRVGVWVHPALSAPRTGDRLRDAYAIISRSMAIVGEEAGQHPEQWWNWDLGRYREADGRTFGFTRPYEIHDFAPRPHLTG